MGQSERMAIFAGLYAGLCFGVFWIPIRLLESGGLDAPWAMAVFTVVPALFSLPVMWRYRRDYGRGAVALSGGVLCGVAFALYAASLLYTEVVRAVLLFYLMPIWGFLLGWVLLGDRITPLRWLAIGLGIVGMVVVFADDTGLPLPRNAGDWCGLASGVFWAVGSLMILTQRRVSAPAHTVNFLVTAAVVSMAVAGVATAQGAAVRPSGPELGEAMWWFVPVVVLLILPAGYATIYAPSKLNPGVAGLLLMTEVVVAAVTAAIWAGEEISLRETAGLITIMVAGLIEPAAALRREARTDPLG